MMQGEHNTLMVRPHPPPAPLPLGEGEEASPSTLAQTARWWRARFDVAEGGAIGFFVHSHRPFGRIQHTHGQPVYAAP